MVLGLQGPPLALPLELLLGLLLDLGLHLLLVVVVLLLLLLMLVLVRPVQRGLPLLLPLHLGLVLLMPLVLLALAVLQALLLQWRAHGPGIAASQDWRVWWHVQPGVVAICRPCNEHECGPSVPPKVQPWESPGQRESQAARSGGGG